MDFKRVLNPLRSRKVRAALVTVIAAAAAEYGLDVPDEVLLGIVSVGVAVILGTAIEDHGEKSKASTTLLPLQSGKNGEQPK